MPLPISQPLVWQQLVWTQGGWQQLVWLQVDGQQLVWEQLGWQQLEPQVAPVEQMGNPQKLVEQHMVSGAGLRVELLGGILVLTSVVGPFIYLGQLLFIKFLACLPCFCLNLFVNIYFASKIT